jgi:mono/diheme cytochrome c family protein
MESFAVREGKRLFAHNCAPCHGENGDGSGKYFGYVLEPQPPDMTAPDFLRDRSDSLLAAAITGGSAALGRSNLCPPWGNTLHSMEIEYLIKFIKKTNEQARTSGEADEVSGNEE